jgi:hypothetical protein
LPAQWNKNNSEEQVIRLAKKFLALVIFDVLDASWCLFSVFYIGLAKKFVDGPFFVIQFKK